jgi:thiol-disulfide isomerase/thioredoxin
MGGTCRTLLGFGLAGGILLSAAAYASPAPEACASAPPALGKYRQTPGSKQIPQAPLLDDAGNEKSLADLRGRGLIVNFWATWCAPCVKEMPALDRLARVADARGLQVLALSSDREGASVVREFYRKNDIRHLPVTIDKLSRVARAVDIDGLPTTVLYDSGGREIGRVIGVAEWDMPAALDFLSSCLAIG